MVENPGTNSIPSIDNLINFLTNKLNILEIIHSTHPDVIKNAQKKGANIQNSVAVVDLKSSSCLFCKKITFALPM